jgi:type 2 lantibiotic biosynthesis protein LanM
MNSPSLNGTDREMAASELEGWRSQPPFAEGSYFAQRLAAQSLTEQELFHCLGETLESLHGRLAGDRSWVEKLLYAFSLPDFTDPLPVPESFRNYETTGFLNLVEPLLQEALTRVQVGAQRLAGSMVQPPFDAGAVPHLLFASLPGKLLWSLSQTLVLELHVARVEGRLQGATAEERFHSFLERLRCREIALAILLEYPVLARQVMICVDNWVDASLEFLERLTADWESICARFSPAEDPGTLVELHGDAGDSHRGGRCVQIAKFSSGLQVVYKPRPMCIDAHFQELLAWLNQRGGHPGFRILKVLDRESHGWMEFVAAQGCQSAEEIDRFYQRQGAYLALLHTLESCDFHSENLIAAGEHPVLIDLEALFHPQIARPNPERQAIQRAGYEMADSVLRVGLLPERIWSSSDSMGIDRSGLGSLPGQLSPMQVPRWEDARTDKMRLVRKRVVMPNSQNRPSLNGQDVNVLQHTEAIVSGFASMYRCLVASRDELLADAGPLARFAGDQVRAILRATSVYGSLLRESFHPDLLRDALDRDRLFDRLWVAIPQSDYLARVTYAEGEDLLNGDIPFFTSRTDSVDVWTSAHERVANFFAEPAMERVRRRLQRMGESDQVRQTWFIRASMAVLSPAGHESPRTPTPASHSASRVNRASLLSAARAIGDRIEALSLRGDQDASWIGLTPLNEHDWTLAPLGLDLYDGLPGLAMFLAYLGKLTGEHRYTALAQAAAAGFQAQVKQAHSSVQQVGGFTGWGGVVYALTHLSALWGQAELLAEAEGIVALLPPRIERDDQFDLISGSAGCIAGLLALHHYAPSSVTLEAARQCGYHLIAHATPLPQGVGWRGKGVSNTPLTGFSHGVSGIAWALLELWAATGDARFRSVACSALDYERSLFSTQEGNWPDLRDSEKHAGKFGMTWCHGAPGIGLAYLCSLAHIDDAEIHQNIDAALQTTLTQGFGGNHSLCHGDLGNLETLLQASLRLKDPRWQVEVERRASSILRSIEQNGWICGNPVSAEAPGLMTGLAGIGYELLRLAAPTRVPSVLALAPPPIETSETKASDQVLAATSAVG